MITKVVLGVALVLIEFSISTLSQNNSLSSHNDTFSTAKFQNISDITTTPSYDTTTAEFKLPENCSTYKVRRLVFTILCKLDEFHYKHFISFTLANCLYLCHCCSY